ncbi:GntR family transcriptional regulator [Devosia sp.]|uniref:GntR family transcriptional regulator n=1 Tax=Devosia sp. TaxID=1871048 RepID=UPI003BACC457
MLKRTSADEIRRGLADRIISGDLPPGTPLDETQIASDFAVSRTPVREALRLLAASGLVDQRPHAKALVAKPDEVELAGMFQVMAYLEALCAGLAAEAMTITERDALDALHGEMAAIVRGGDTARYAEANDLFHTRIYDGAHNGYLSEITRSTRQRLQPFRLAQFGALGRLAKSHAEHGLIVEAILRGDRAEAEGMMRSHIVIVGDEVQRLGHPS